MLGSAPDVLKQACAKPDTVAMEAEEKAASAAEPLSSITQHKKVLDHGVPDDAMVGIRNIQVRRLHTI